MFQIKCPNCYAPMKANQSKCDYCGSEFQIEQKLKIRKLTPEEIEEHHKQKFLEFLEDERLNDISLRETMR